MCGLVGVGGNLYAKDLQAFENGLWADAVRGFHSTGIAVLKNNWQTDVLKTPGSPMMLWGKKDYDNLMSCGNRLFLGHNRHATVGNVCEENAHPFEFEMVVGAHNGTLRGRSDKALVNRDKFGTDSETLYYNINEFGVEDIIPEVEGAWALTWVNKAEKTLNFLRNDERPLAYCFSKNGQNIYWASELNMLKWVVLRNGIEVSDAGFLTLKSNTWVRWEIPATFSQSWQAPEIGELKGYSAPPFVRGIDHMREVMNGWAPQKSTKEPVLDAARLPAPSGTQSGANPLAQSELDLKPKSLPVKPLNENGGTKDSKIDPMTGTILPGLPAKNQRSTNAYLLGKAAGKAGRSGSCNPFTGGTKSREWTRGRLDGIEEMVGLAPGNSNVRIFAVKGYNGETVSESEWKRRTGQTCSCCDAVVDWTAMDDAHWVASDTFYCDDCVEQTKFSAEFLKEAV